MNFLRFKKTEKEQGVALGLACNFDAAPITNIGDGWLLLAPYGETTYWHEEAGGEWKAYRQVFTREQGTRMAAAFNALAARKADGFRGLPIYAGHPDADPKRWPDERRLGGVTAVEARDDGLYVRAAWNDLGEKNRAEGYLVYPSPAWLYDRRAARRNGIIAPDELRSVGLTNTPRLPDVPAWTNADDAPEDPSHINPNPETTMNYKSLLLEHLGLPEDATDEAIQLAHTTARANAQQTTQERDQARDEAGRFRAAAVNAQLDAAVNAGRLSAAEREEFAGRFAADFDAASRELGERRLALNTHALGLRPTGAGVDLSTAHGRSLAFNSRIDALTRPVADGGRGLRFDAAITEMRAHPEDAVLLRAMEGR